MPLQGRRFIRFSPARQHQISSKTVSNSTVFGTFGTPAYSELTKFTHIFLKIENYILTTTHHKNKNLAGN